MTDEPDSIHEPVQRFDAVCMVSRRYGCTATPSPDHMKDWLSPQEYVGGPLVVDDPGQTADSKATRKWIYESMPDRLAAGAPIPSDTEAMVDRVVKGVLDGTVSRSQVRTIKGAITGREASDAGSDSLGRAIGAKKP